MFNKYFNATSLSDLVVKMMLFLIIINIAFTCLFYSTDILLDKPQEVLVLLGEIALLIGCVLFGRKIQKINHEQIHSNPNKMLSCVLSLALFLAIFYYIFCSTSGMMQSANLIDAFKMNLIESGTSETAFHRFIICIIAQFGVWAPVHISICFASTFLLNFHAKAKNTHQETTKEYI